MLQHEWDVLRLKHYLIYEEEDINEEGVEIGEVGEDRNEEVEEDENEEEENYSRQTIE